MPDWLNPARLLAGLIVLVIVVFGAVLWITGALTHGKAAQVEARLGANRADAALAAASDSVNTIATVAASAAAGDELTRENERDIRQAPGAAAPVDPALRDAGLRGLCKRAAYRGSQQCLQFAAPR